MTPSAAQPLAGRHVWLTRPAHQAAVWQKGLQAAGAQVAVEPLIDILPVADEQAADAALDAAAQAHIVIATSRNAIDAAWRLRPHLSLSGQLFAVGDATAAALQRATGNAVAVPDTADTSEGLLAMAGLAQVAGLSVVLLSGEGGRRKLVDTLARRGAHVRKAVLYRRRGAHVSAQRLRALLAHNDAAIVTSGEAVRHLCELLRQHAGECTQALPAPLQLVVPSARVVQLVPGDLFQYPPCVAARMTLDAVVRALSQRGATA